MQKITVATFNIENLLQRYDFSNRAVFELLDINSDINLKKSFYVGLTDDVRQITAQAIRDTNADIICLQEVDNLKILNSFYKYYLNRSAGVRYKEKRLIEGNDPRGIDIAVMSNLKIVSMKSHKNLKYGDLGLQSNKLKADKKIFRRDCVEIECEIGDKKLTIFSCHFKSMVGNRKKTKPIREAEAKAVKKLIEKRFKKPKNENWIIMGDLNDYMGEGSSLNLLVDNNFSYNMVKNLPKKEQWTTYYAKEKSFNQLDYILLSPKLYKKNSSVKPKIIRAGQPYRVPVKVDRYPRVGFDRPKASDHCPVSLEMFI